MKEIANRSLEGQFLDAFPFFKGADEEIVREIVGKSSLVEIEAGTLLAREGQRCSEMSFHLSGEKRVYNTNDRGREITLYEVGGGEICIIQASCILAGQPVGVFAKALTPLRVLTVEADRFVDLIDAHPALRNFVFSSINLVLSDIIELVDEIVFRKMDSRLMDYLIKKSENDLLQATHQMIADDLGTAREVVSRLLKELERNGQVVASRNSVRLKKTEKWVQSGL